MSTSRERLNQIFNQVRNLRMNTIYHCFLCRQVISFDDPHGDICQYCYDLKQAIYRLDYQYDQFRPGYRVRVKYLFYSYPTHEYPRIESEVFQDFPLLKAIGLQEFQNGFLPLPHPLVERYYNYRPGEDFPHQHWGFEYLSAQLNQD